MSQIAIQKYKDPETTPQTLLQKMEAIVDSIRERAFSLFQSRNGGNGSDLEDWLQAERDVVWSPASELVDGEKEFTARVAVPGFDAKDIHVSALPDSLIVQADSSSTQERKKDNVCFSEFSERELFRHLPLPSPVDVDKVTALLDKGVLQIIAPKAAPKQASASA